MIAPSIDILKGIHPGIFLGHELKKRKLTQYSLSMSIHEHSQNLSSVILGKRNMNPKLALKIEEALGLEEGFLMRLQTYYDYKKIRQAQNPTTIPDLTKFRKATFWDTRLEKIDWHTQKRGVIQRIFERGNESEKNEIKRFYGESTVTEILQELNNHKAC